MGCSGQGASISPAGTTVRAEYICADPLSRLTFRLQKNGGPYICSGAYTLSNIEQSRSVDSMYSVAMEVLAKIVSVEIEGDDGLIVTFSDATEAAYVVEELLELRPHREPIESSSTRVALD